MQAALPQHGSWALVFCWSCCACWFRWLSPAHGCPRPVALVLQTPCFTSPRGLVPPKLQPSLPGASMWQGRCLPVLCSESFACFWSVRPGKGPWAPLCVHVHEYVCVCVCTVPYLSYLPATRLPTLLTPTSVSSCAQHCLGCLYLLSYLILTRMFMKWV